VTDAPDGAGVRAWRVLAPGCLDGQTALVTGAGSGIGRAIALRLEELGATVFGLGRHRETLEETAAAGDGRIAPLVCDVRDPDAVEAAVASAAAADGLQILVNNAGGQFYAPATSISRNGWRSVIDLNLDAVFSIVSAAHEHLARRGGSVLSISLAGVERGSPGMAHSIAARAGVLGLTRTLALEWATEGIRLNCLSPGQVMTEAVDPSFADRVPELVPAGRATDVAEVAEYAAFLASPAAAMITGQILHLDGGIHIGPEVDLLPRDPAGKS
jgi:citronellol/citronellal dehydrogenase